MADIPIQRKEGRNIWPMLLGLLVLLAALWFIFGRNDAGNTAAARADSAAASDSSAVARGDVVLDSATAMTGGGMAAGTARTAALGDMDIANVVHEVNTGEIAAAEIAQSKATNADVKAYARDMIAAHRSLDRKGANITGATGTANAALRDSVVNANQAMASRLQSANSGAEFDRTYVDGQVAAHQNTLSFLQAAQNQARNADLKELVTAAIPDVQKHLDRAKALQSKVGQ